MQWPGLPAGVKFHPSDSELLEHLEEKVGLGGSNPHVLIDEFIPTIDNDEGICYSHPENLPGRYLFLDICILLLNLLVHSCSKFGSY